MTERPECPACKSHDVRKHGQHLGKQRWFCKFCGFAFTGDVYRRRPENEIKPIIYQNEQLLKIIKIAIFMRKAQNEYLMKPCSRTFMKKQIREAKFDELAANIFPKKENVTSGQNTSLTHEA
jgi:Zn ribbon nucleic-acid-binding protein